MVSTSIVKRQPKKKTWANGQVQRRAAVRKMRILQIPQELKFFDTALSFSFDLTPEVPATGQLALIPQGDTESTRDGRQARIKSIHIRGALTMSRGALIGDAFGVELYVVQDKQANGAAAAAGDVFTSAGAIGLVSSFRNLNNNRRFRILKHYKNYPSEVGTYFVTSESAAGTFTGYTGVFPVDLYIPCDILMDWNGTTGAITEITSNNIFLVASCGGANGDDRGTFAGNCRLRFVG